MEGPGAACATPGSRTSTSLAPPMFRKHDCRAAGTFARPAPQGFGPAWRARPADKAGYDGSFGNHEDAATGDSFHVEHYRAPTAGKS